MAESDFHGLLRDLLDREQAALLAGRLDELARLVPEKERIAAHLFGDATPMDADALTGLRQIAERNARLLEAARRGIEAARERIDQIRNGGPQMQTYDRRGRRSSLSGAPSRVKRRA